MKQILYCLTIVLVIMVIYKISSRGEHLIEAPVGRGPAWMNSTLLAVESNLPQKQLPLVGFNSTLQRKFGMEFAGKADDSIKSTKTSKTEKYAAGAMVENYAAGAMVENYADPGLPEHYVPTVDNGEVYGYFKRPPSLPQLPFMPVTSVIYQ